MKSTLRVGVALALGSAMTVNALEWRFKKGEESKQVFQTQAEKQSGGVGPMTGNPMRTWTNAFTVGIPQPEGEAEDYTYSVNVTPLHGAPSLNLASADHKIEWEVSFDGTKQFFLSSDLTGAAQGHCGVEEATMDCASMQDVTSLTLWWDTEDLILNIETTPAMTVIHCGQTKDTKLAKNPTSLTFKRVVAVEEGTEPNAQLFEEGVDINVDVTPIEAGSPLKWRRDQPPRTPLTPGMASPRSGDFEDRPVEQIPLLSPRSALSSQYQGSGTGGWVGNEGRVFSPHNEVEPHTQSAPLFGGQKVEDNKGLPEARTAGFPGP